MGNILTKQSVDFSQLPPEEQVAYASNQMLTIGNYRSPEHLGVKEGGKLIRLGKQMTNGEFVDTLNKRRCEMHMFNTLTNMCAEFCLREAVDAFRKDKKLFRFEFKKTCNTAQRVIKDWHKTMAFLMDSHYEVMYDMITDRLSEVVPDIKSLYFQVFQRYTMGGVKNPALAAWAEVVQQMFVMSQRVIKSYTRAVWELDGIDMQDMFRHCDLCVALTPIWEENICFKFVDYTTQVKAINEDINIQRALQIFVTKLVDSDSIYRHMKEALNEHIDVFGKEEAKSIRRDIAEVEAEIAEKEKRAEQGKKRKEKPRASDVTSEDLEQLRQHFS